MPKKPLMVFAERCMEQRRMFGDVDIVLRRSFDHGQAWQPQHNRSSPISSATPVAILASFMMRRRVVFGSLSPAAGSRTVSRTSSQAKCPTQACGSRTAMTMARSGPRRATSPRPRERRTVAGMSPDLARACFCAAACPKPTASSCRLITPRAACIPFKGSFPMITARPSNSARMLRITPASRRSSK